MIPNQATITLCAKNEGTHVEHVKSCNMHVVGQVLESLYHSIQDQVATAKLLKFNAEFLVTRNTTRIVIFGVIIATPWLVSLS